nr:2Fe-2S iron-sulfur cluster binding domain-containing protein [Pseudomonas sp. MWU16-30317]
MLPVQERAEAPPPDEDLQPCDPQGEFEIELARDGLIIKVAAGESVLEAVRGVRTGLSFSCSDGYCGTCETRVLSGIPDHRDSVLTYAEKHANKSMMICVSRACTRRLRLDL